VATIKLRRDDLADWNSVNPVLADGEPGWDRTTDEMRVGDGTTDWDSLPPINARVRVRALAGTTGNVGPTDLGTVVETTNGSAVAVTVLAGTAGDVVEVCQYGAGQITFAGDSGVTLRSASGLKTRAQYSSTALRWRTGTEVVLTGDLTA
jgi:hypothetical protein